ncbi:hypothetical protein J6590_102227, partial [Homalodisca vitripennis]
QCVQCGGVLVCRLYRATVSRYIICLSDAISSLPPSPSPTTTPPPSPLRQHPPSCFHDADTDCVP